MRGTSDYVPVSTLAAATGIVSREWGEYGYSLAVHYVGLGSTIFELRAGDGSKRLLRVDRYGNYVVAPAGMSLDTPSEVWQHWARWASDELTLVRGGHEPRRYEPEGVIKSAAEAAIEAEVVAELEREYEVAG